MTITMTPDGSVVIPLEARRMRSVQLVTSTYAIGEGRRHVSGQTPDRFERLLLSMEEVEAGNVPPLPSDVQLMEKDRPILAAALAARSDVL